MAAAAALPAAAGAASQIGKALTGDIVTFHGQVYRRTTMPNLHRKKGQPKEIEVLVPVDVDLHVNPVSVGLALAGGAVAVFIGWAAWNGVKSPLGGQIVPGIQNSPLGERIREGKPNRRVPRSTTPNPLGDIAGFLGGLLGL